jgi:hypothetical protein
MGYELGKIYIIRCGEYFYYGSCITSILRRACTHKYRAKNKTNKLYDYIKDKEWTIELVKKYACNSKEELRTEEDKYVRPNLSNNLCLNERCAVWDIEKDIRRKKEWYKNNRERLLIKAKEYYINKNQNQ